MDLETMQKTIQKTPETIQKALEERSITITGLQMDILVYFYRLGDSDPFAGSKGIMKSQYDICNCNEY